MANLLARVRAAHAFEIDRFLPLDAEGRVGWIRRDLVASLHRWPDVFAIDERSVRLRPGSGADRTAALAKVTRDLVAAGTISGWRDETYAIRASAQSAPLFHIERAAVRFFGLTSSASHLNGFVQGRDGMRVWIARRSATKSIDPNRLDSLVGGGIPSGQDSWQALLRECHEEAGIESALAVQATAVGALAVCHEVPEGLHSEILYAHDLALPADFQPRNVDAEVSEFKLLSPMEVADRVANEEFTVEAGLVTLDFLVRRQEIADPEVVTALDRCRVRP
jgi:8-oxo-dGTP pyrophosphatase MutT (NUDIX family)